MRWLLNLFVLFAVSLSAQAQKQDPTFQALNNFGVVLIDAADFQKEVLERSEKLPVLAIFTSDQCGYCARQVPLVEKALAGYRGRIERVYIYYPYHLSTPQGNERIFGIADGLGLSGAPTIIVFHKRKPIAQAWGGGPDDDKRLQIMIEHVLSKPIEFPSF